MVLSSFGYFLAVGTQLSVLPIYVEETLGGGATAIGLTFGAFGISAALLRLWIGPLGDRQGRRVLIVAGSIIVAIALGAHALADAIWQVFMLRLLLGVGEAAVFVGVATAVQDLAPPDRRGEAASYFSLSTYGGLAVGPLIGESVLENHGNSWAFIVGAMLGLAGAGLGLFAPGKPRHPVPRPKTLIHRGALRPGCVLGLNLLGYVGFLSFATLHAGDIGIERTGTLFAELAATIAFMRLFFAKLPDRLGPIRTSQIGLTTSAIGLFGLYFWQEPVGAYAAVAVYAVGQSLMFPALFVVAVQSAREDQRGHAISTFSLFWDAAIGVGGFAIGGIVALTDRPTAFLVGAVAAVIDLLLLQVILGPVLDRGDQSMVRS